jgi:hypothetical protein
MLIVLGVGKAVAWRWRLASRVAAAVVVAVLLLCMH